MFYFLLSLISSITYKNPPYTMIMSGIYGCEYLLEMYMENLDEAKKQCKKSKEGDEIYEACQILGPLEGLYCSSSAMINDDISKISKNTKLLIIGYIGSSITFDFNQLPTSNTDVILMYGFSNYKQTSKNFKSQITFENIANAIHKLSNISVPFSLNKEEFRNMKESSKLSLAGDIKNKINTLSIISESRNSFPLEIIDNDLNIDNLNLIGVDISKDSRSIRCKRLVVDNITHLNIISNDDIKQLINVSLYGISLDYENPLQVVIDEDRWRLKKKDENDDWIPYADNSYNEVPYKNAETICILSDSNEYDINVPNKNVKNGRNVNITASQLSIDSPIDISISKLLEEKPKLTVTKSGDWDGIQKDTLSIVVNYDKSKYTADISEDFQNAGINVEQQEPYIYPPTKEKGKNLGLIIGVTVACVVVVVVVIVVVVIVIKKKKKSQDKSVSEGEGNEDNV